MWLVRQVLPQVLNCVERTYAENVHVVNGRALVNTQSALNFLHTCGYKVVRKLPEMDELMRTNPGHVINLGRDGLGPLAGRSAAELDALQAELKETGRVVELQGAVVVDDVEPGAEALDLNLLATAAELQAEVDRLKPLEAEVVDLREELVRRSVLYERLQATEAELKAAIVAKERLEADHVELQQLFQQGAEAAAVRLQELTSSEPAEEPQSEVPVTKPGKRGGKKADA